MLLERKMKKTLVVLFLCGSMFSTNVAAKEMLSEGNVLTQEIESEGPESIAKNLTESLGYGNVITNGSLHIKSSELRLLVTFENRENALNNFKKRYETELKLIGEKAGFSVLDNSNHESWKIAVNEYMEEGVISPEKTWDMLAFFDVYENDEDNENIRTLANAYFEKIKMKSSDSENVLAQIDAISPLYNDTLLERKKTHSSNRSMNLPSLSAAVEWANAHSTNYNRAFHYYAGKDCTNFVSQILWWSGIGMEDTGNEKLGWWYRIKGQPNQYAASITWINANDFTRYMGRGRAISKWGTLLNELHPGSFIAADNGGDGVIDHNAFVTAKRAGEVKIAQHSSDYHKWSNSTNWIQNPSNRRIYHVR